MDKPTHRILALLELLQVHARISGAELSERLGIDRRSVRRYIARLEAIGIPIRTERGRDGGYALMPGFRLPPMLFNADEALALSLGLRTARELGLDDMGVAIASAQAKLERVMPAAMRQRIRDIDEAVVVDLSKPFAGSATAPLVALAGAVRAGQTVHLHYRAPSLRETEREFDPYGVAYLGGAWYCAGWCHLRRELRSFRLDRIVSVVPLPKAFGRPADFNVVAYLQEAFTTMPRTHAVAVRLDADLRRARRELFCAIGSVGEEDGRVVLRAQVDDLAWFARELSRLPFAFRVETPGALAGAVRAHATRLLQQAAVDRRARKTIPS